jgi:hypothetical protein
MARNSPYYRFAWRPLHSHYNGPLSIALYDGFYLAIIMDRYGGPQNGLTIALHGGPYLAIIMELYRGLQTALIIGLLGGLYLAIIMDRYRGPQTDVTCMEAPT